jgi:hypothetical protein
MTNVENPGVICSPVFGNGIGGLRDMSNAEVTLAAADVLGVLAATGNNPGTRCAIREDKHATMNDTTET